MNRTLKYLLPVILATSFLPMVWPQTSLTLANASEKSMNELKVMFQKRTIGSVKKFEVTSDKEDPSRLLITSTVRLDSLLSVLDDTLVGRRNLRGRFSQRLYWQGGTTIRHGGQTLGLTSRIRYEQWTRIDLLFETLTTRLLRVSTNLEWVLGVESGGLDELKIVAEITNVRNVPPIVEEWLGLRIRRDIKIPIPTNCGTCNCADIAESLDLEVRSVSFETTDNTLHLVAQFSAKGNLTEVLGCL